MALGSENPPFPSGRAREPHSKGVSSTQRRPVEGRTHTLYSDQSWTRNKIHGYLRYLNYQISSGKRGYISVNILRKIELGGATMNAMCY